MAVVDGLVDPVSLTLNCRAVSFRLARSEENVTHAF